MIDVAMITIEVALSRQLDGHVERRALSPSGFFESCEPGQATGELLCDVTP